MFCIPIHQLSLPNFITLLQLETMLWLIMYLSIIYIETMYKSDPISTCRIYDIADSQAHLIAKFQQPTAIITLVIQETLISPDP